MELTQLLFIFSIICFALGAFRYWIAPDTAFARVNWLAAGLCLFAIAIMMA